MTNPYDAVELSNAYSRAILSHYSDDEIAFSLAQLSDHLLINTEALRLMLANSEIITAETSLEVAAAIEEFRNRLQPLAAELIKKLGLDGF